MIIDPEADRLFPEKTVATVKIYTKGGVFSETVDKAKSLTDKELKDKFRKLASYVLTPEKIEKLITIINNLKKYNINNVHYYSYLYGQRSYIMILGCSFYGNIR